MKMRDELQLMVRDVTVQMAALIRICTPPTACSIRISSRKHIHVRSVYLTFHAQIEDEFTSRIRGYFEKSINCLKTKTSTLET
jgi:hypothetical protein